jgi:hypothetical protein
MVAQYMADGNKFREMVKGTNSLQMVPWNIKEFMFY